MMENKYQEEERYRLAYKRVKKIKGFYIHALVYVLVNTYLIISSYAHIQHSDKDFFNYEVDKSTYLHWGILKENTTIPVFVKAAHGIGYSIEIKGNDTIATPTNNKRYNLDILIKELLLDKKLKKLKMKGQFSVLGQMLHLKNLMFLLE